MDTFLDTNVPIAYLFLFEPSNSYSEKIFEEYDDIYWSSNVINEFNNRVSEKQEYILEFYYDLDIYLNEISELINIGMIFSYLKNNDYGKKENDIKSSFKYFWNSYFPYEEYIPISHMKEALKDFRRELSNKLHQRRNFINSYLILPQERTYSYFNIKKNLKNLDLHNSDIEIILDGHDVGLNLDNPLDFITFDKLCGKGANMESLSFNKVKTHKDYE